VALLTLVLNGVTAPHVLKLLKLAKPVPSRKRALKVFEVQAEEHVLREYKWLVSQPRFREVSFIVIKTHVPLIRKEITSMDDFNRINYRTLSEFDNNFAKGDDDESSRTLYERFASVSHRMDSHSDLVAEIRALFQELLDEIYADDRDAGELVGQEHSIVNIDVLRQSMALFSSSNAVVEPINNWEFTHITVSGITANHTLQRSCTDSTNSQQADTKVKWQPNSRSTCKSVSSKLLPLSAHIA